MALRNVILEIGTEEIPSRFLPEALDSLERLARSALSANRLGFKDVRTYATPRRLVLSVRELDETQNSSTEVLKGPPLSSAYDSEGNPTRAALGFAKSKGVDVNALCELEVDGVRYVAAEVHEESRRTLDVLPDLLRGLVEGLSFPKSMYWSDPGVRFARPIRWILALADDAVVPFEYGDVRSGRTTSGHRFMGQKVIEVRNAGEFLERLYDNNVILDQEKRRQKLEAAISLLKQDFEGDLEVEMDPELLEENLFLVEFPVPFIGSFDERYLEIPEEVLITSMKKNQKYFAVRSRDKGNALANVFIGVSNNRASDMRRIREGNERVLRARLEDAAFFWAEDRKRSLASNVERLKNVTYQEKLGSVYDKVMQTQKLALWICSRLGKDDLARLVDRAAYLSKADLVTRMVYEFTELQGVMGREYARHDGEDPRVALALYEQYLPRSASDTLPTDDVGAILGLAERVHIVVNCHKAGLEPTGSQDPYGLRRAARCINEILWGRCLDLDLGEVVREAALLNLVDQLTVERILAFLELRLLMQLKEKGYEHELATLALSVAGHRPLQALRLMEALNGVKDEHWFSGLMTSAVRVRNILNKAPDAEGVVDAALLDKPAERALHDEVARLEPMVGAALEARDWQALMELLAELSPVVSAFFEDVMVMDPDERVRANRLALLKRCNALFERVGDLGALKGQAQK
ncbi:glycine--tRNA ligase subunit beta [Fretibacterium sp. OH1220_COT-178]|uniref:glycine--tRNA ligase subunit beta n=1 Tax=Fretibacterium sp. OH1220_COT-178 TaxID=2491047 RepID=UPI000F5E0141|nr:glycine--tRNA ligase subunit beta [Fretibacterium sp. OH1220_COT-178]RRD65249.1 glycine--tRNA ligase subunit beta [Fretibacterium sp. OH1220_COT-178]